MKSFVCCLLLNSLLWAAAPAQTAGFADAVLGRWDLTVQGADGVRYPSWMEIRLRKETELMASFVGRFGSVRYASRAEYANGELTVAIPAQYESGPKELVFRGKSSGEGLAGTALDEQGRTISWSAVRAPDLRATQPAVWGQTVSLFNGRDRSGWKPRTNAHGDCWRVADGVLTNQTPCTDLISERTFGDFKLHVEFQTVPQGNSGVYLRGRYEVQISDGYQQTLDSLRMGAVYGFLKPAVNAARKPGEWQTLDITLIGRKVTVALNGQTLIDNETIPGITGGALDSDEGAPGPIMLQGDHTKILYRKIEITPSK
jgi:Domain of Unknown Function (DUF1080)